MVEIKVVSMDPKSGWFFGQVIGRNGNSLMIRDLDLPTKVDADLKRAKLHEVREIKKIPLFSLVIPYGGTTRDWSIGHVIGMSCLDLSIGPVLHVRDILTGKEVRELPHLVDRLVRDSSNQLA